MAQQRDSGAPRVRIQALGGFRIFLDGRDLRLRTRKEATLLLRLALAGDAGVSRDECVGLLWPESSEARARHSLSEALRGIELATGLEIGRTPERLALPVAAHALDVRDLEVPIAEGDVHACARLYAGGFLAGWYPSTPDASHWVDGVGAGIATRLEKMLRRELVTRRRATDSRGVTAAVELLELIGAATDEDREVAAEAEEITAWEDLRPGETLQPRNAADREGPFVGRVEEMRLLTRELERAMAGEVRVVIVSGDAGIGKTRTCQRLARLAALRGARLFLASCYELEQSVAYGAMNEALSGSVTATDLAALKQAWRDTLAELLPGMSAYAREPASPYTDRASGEARLLHATSALVEHLCRERSGVLLFDDAQWADATSTRVVHHLRRRCEPRAGLLIVVAARPVDSEANAMLSALLRDGETTRVDLSPLSPSETKEQVRRLRADLGPVMLDRIARRSAGNPLFARELAAVGSASDEPPPTIRKTVDARLQTLPAALQNMLAILAVAGRRIHIEALSGALGSAPTQLLSSLVRLRTLRLIREDGPMLSLDHDLVRESIYASLGEAARAACHKALALADPHLSSAARARHFELAGLAREAAVAALEGAAAAEARFATREQLDLLELALRNSDQHGRPVVAHKFASICIEAGQYGRLLNAIGPDEPLTADIRLKRDLASLKRSTLKSLSSREEVARVTEGLLRRAAQQSPGDFVEIARERLRYAQEVNDVPAVLRTIEQLHAFATHAPSPVIGAQALCVAAYQQAYYAPGPHVERSFTSALETGRSSGDARLIVQARLGLGICAVIDGRTNEVERNGREAFMVARKHGLLIEELRAGMMLTCVALDRWRPRRAISHAVALRRRADVVDQWNPLMLSWLTETAAWLELDQPANALAQARQVLALEREHPDWLVRANAHALSGLALLRLGRPAEAKVAMAAVEGFVSDLPNWIDDPTPILELIAGVAATDRELAEALRLSERVAAKSVGRNRSGHWGASLVESRIRLRLGRPLDFDRLAGVRAEAAAAGNMLVVAHADGVLPPLAVGA